MNYGQTLQGDAYSGTVDGHTSYIEYYEGTIHGVPGGPAYTRAALFALTGPCGSSNPNSCDTAPNTTFDGGGYPSAAGYGGAHRWPQSPCGIAGSSYASGSCGSSYAGVGVQSNAVAVSYGIINVLVNGTSD
jgi:hypothetical protein